MSIMKAIIHEEYGPPENLLIKEIAIPKPKSNEILVKVFASTVNRTDCAILRAKPFIMRFVTGFLKPKNNVGGTEFAGEIAGIGSELKGLELGDRIFGFSDLGLCAHAEYMILKPGSSFDFIAENISYEQAAASIEGAHYAYNILNKVDIISGQNILVNGATGAIGSALVQLLKSQGVHITAVCNTKNVALIKALGAEKTIDYLKEDFTKSNDKFDFIFDAVGKSTFGKCKALLKPGGAYISSELGPWAQNIFYALFTPLLAKLPSAQKRKVVKFPFPSNIKNSITYVNRLIEKGQYQSVIDRVYPLEKITEAFNYVETGEKTGNVVLKIN